MYSKYKTVRRERDSWQTPDGVSYSYITDNHSRCRHERGAAVSCLPCRSTGIGSRSPSLTTRVEGRISAGVVNQKSGSRRVSSCVCLMMMTPRPTQFGSVSNPQSVRSSERLRTTSEFGKCMINQFGVDVSVSLRFVLCAGRAPGTQYMIVPMLNAVVSLTVGRSDR